MFTNTELFGGNFKNVLVEEFESSKNITIASGYTSIDILRYFRPYFIEKAQNGGVAKLLIGMAFYEGLSQNKLEMLNELCLELNNINQESGVFVTFTRKYHGKVYHFDNINYENIYVGSSNFSNSGSMGNIECTLKVKDLISKTEVKDFIKYLFSTENSISILNADIIVPGSKKYSKKISLIDLENLKNHKLKKGNFEEFPFFEYPLTRIAEKEKSNLNVYFGKGRLNKKTGIVKARNWYEIELIANSALNTNPLYPKGDFEVYTDDGYIIPMRTQGDYFKNIRSKNSLQIFGMWLKGKLQKSGALLPLTPVTNDTLIDYGNDKLKFIKMSEGKYLLVF